MRLTLTIDMDGAAFEDLWDSEVARILTDTARHIQSLEWNGRDGYALRDINGNTVGKVEVQS